MNSWAAFGLPVACLHGRSRPPVSGAVVGQAKRDLRHLAMTSLTMYLGTPAAGEGTLV